MRLSILCFTFGVWLLQQQGALPIALALSVLAGFGAVLLALAALARRLRIAAAVGAFLLGFAWAGGMAHWRLADALPEANEGRDIVVVGVVNGLPQRLDHGLRFNFKVEQADFKVPAQLSLAWYRGWRREADEEGTAERSQSAVPDIHAGERWRLTLRLKRPHGNLNPHGFDYEAWLLEAGIRATGYVRPASDNARLEAFVATPSTLVEHLRESIRARFLRILPDAPYVGILIALTVGDQRAIDNEQWQLFSRSGITHLMSISGLHVTMFASFAYALLLWLWRRSPALMLRLPAQKAAVVGGFLAAFGYCLLSGFAVPAQRTLYMLAVVALALWTQRVLSASRVLALALLLVLLLDPWAVLAAGFWLSFGAVGVLFYLGGGRLGKAHWLAEWGRAQWAVTVGMIPALLLLFQQFSLVSPLTNALAIPLVSFVITPLAMLAAAIPPLGFLLVLAHWITAGMMAFVAWLADFSWAVWQQHAPPVWALLLALAGSAWLLLPRGFPARWLGAVLFLPLLYVPPARPPTGEATLTLLDVGQGLAIHVQTASHDLLYDTGPIFSLEANSGDRIIVPYLRAKGVSRLDGMVISHQDNDHAGGAKSVLDAVPVGWMINSLPFEHELSAVPVETLSCYDGQSWQWDGVLFEVLHPQVAQYDAPAKVSNTLSCVLRVSNAYGSVLLTADVQSLSEQAMLARHSSRLRADVLLAPHHGSRTSSTPKFIAAVAPKDVVFPVGYRNRFHHPHAETINRYLASGARLHRTDLEGALTLRIVAGGVVIEAEREIRRRYWHGQ